MTATKLEQDLNSARMSFNISRAALAASLQPCKAREGAEDRLISSAEEYGIDQVVQQLSDNAFLFDLTKAPSVPEIAKIRTALTSAYHATHRLDEAMAKREEALCKEDPSRTKGIILDGREAEIDTAKGIVRFRDNGETQPLQAERVEPAHTDGGHANENEREY